MRLSAMVAKADGEALVVVASTEVAVSIEEVGVCVSIAEVLELVNLLKWWSCWTWPNAPEAQAKRRPRLDERRMIKE